MIDATLNPCINSNASLGIDQACLSILNLYLNPVIFYAIAWEAYTGTGFPITTLNPESNTSLVIDTKYPLHIYYKSVEPNRTYEYCHSTYTFKEHGSYGWNISAAHLCSDIYVIHEPGNPYFPILIAFAIYMLLAVVWITSKIIMQIIRRKLSSNNVHDDLDRLQEENLTHPVIRTTKFSSRVQSVDAFRGIAILLMIFVNNGGGKYVFFNHSAWFGLFVADLVLPWFAWIMGLTITISKRTELRLTTSRDILLQFGRFVVIRDILDSWPQWLIMAGIVTTHTLITFLLPVPNCPTGYFGPGGKYHYREHYMNCTAGAAGYIDRLIFGNHLYNKTNNSIYGKILPYDPEGLMNTISAIFIVYLGVHAGKILLLYYQPNARVIRWFVWAIFTGIIAGILCNFETQGGVIPVSKRMMTLSYVLASSSLAFLLYALLYVLIDYKQLWNGAPFIYAGINPIFLYVGHILTKDLFPWAWNIAHPSHASVLAMNLWTTTLWAIIAYLLYRNDIIITV
ncbi:hypothetical protein E2986_03944 [Frieseomelitta varia]|uniref:Heparan-alpha-glucosaminide N-acetyltransferase n=1 Tax=Frieseomelitta varia TaxID=561572 RepID=A0A833RGU1_9HYME|nr:hypothetical protein E2986_03944 [Frieseomelitta varia]